jgi:hypothetical protein
MSRATSERQKFGRFYYRFPNGEAGTDVFDRMSDFISTLFQSMDAPADGEGGDADEDVDNYVLVTHGLLMRIFCMCYLKWTVDEFNQVWNPSNCEIWVLEKLASGEYELSGRWRASPYGGTFGDIKFGANRNQRMWDHMKQPATKVRQTPAAHERHCFHFRCLTVPRCDMLAAPDHSRLSQLGRQLGEPRGSGAPAEHARTADRRAVRGIDARPVLMEV